MDTIRATRKHTRGPFPCNINFGTCMENPVAHAAWGLDSCIIPAFLPL